MKITQFKNFIPLLLLAIFFELFGQKEIESNESIMVAGHYKLAMVYLNGDGVERDYQQAFKWFTQAANLGHPESSIIWDGCIPRVLGGCKIFPWQQSGTLKQLNKELLLLNLTLESLS